MRTRESASLASALRQARSNSPTFRSVPAASSASSRAKHSEHSRSSPNPTTRAAHPEAQRDWIGFLWNVEERYWTGMYRFLKDDLKVVAPVLGTQMGWSPAPIQAKLDLIDSHAYWQHPHFPRKQWDPADWVVNNLPMTGRPDGGTLPGLALTRVAGKPFICTEYNHSAPNTYAAETFPLIFAFAALQDWDGVFAFAYSHRHDDWNTGKIPSFFDVDQHPTKMATLPAAAALFLRGDVPASAPMIAVGTAAGALRRRPPFRPDAAWRSIRPQPPGCAEWSGRTGTQ